MIRIQVISRSLLMGFCVLMLNGALPTLAQEADSPCSLDLERDPLELADGDNPLSGRLGFTLEAWESQFGEPKEADSFFPEYDIEGCGTVLLNLNADDTIVNGITAYAPRDMERDLNEADPDDWKIGHIQLVASSFAPIDSESGETYTVPNPYGYIRFDYSSDQLLAELDEAEWDFVDNDPDYGSYSIIYNLTEDETFVSVSLSLSLEEPPFVE